MGKVHVYRADGTRETLERDHCPPLEELQELVGGYIEPVLGMFNGQRTQLIVNEDGWPQRLPLNPAMRDVWGRPLVGTIVVLEGLELE